MADKNIFIASGPKKPKVPTSPFDWSFTNRLTARFGRIYPCLVAEVPAKSRIEFTPLVAFDMMPLKFPVQTNVRCHLKFYKVPMRILCDKFEDFISQIGEDGLPVNTSQAPITMPFISRQNWVKQGSLADYMGLPTNVLSQVEAFIPSHPERLVWTSSPSIDWHAWTAPTSAMLSSNYSLHKFFVPISDGDELFNSNNTETSLQTCTLMLDVITSASDNTYPDFDISCHLFRKSESGNPWFKPIYNTDLSPESLNSSNLGKYSCFVYSQNYNGQSFFVHRYYFRLPTAMLDRIKAEKSSGYTSYLAFNPVNVNAASLWFSLYAHPASHAHVGLTTIADSEKPEDVTVINPYYGVTQSCRYFAKRSLSSNPQVFDAIGSAAPELPINALPFRAYEFVYNYFLRNPRISPFLKNGIPVYNQFITNTGIGADTTTPLEFYNSLYETDLFTSCVKEPQFGNAPLVGVTLNDLGDTGTLHFSDDHSQDFDVSVSLDHNGDVLPLSVYPSGTANDPAISRLKDLINFGISINDLRNVSTFQRALERLQRTDLKYQNVVYEFFGTNPPIGDHYPTFLGGYTTNMRVGKVTNTAMSQNAKLGEFAGTGFFSGKGKKIKCFTTEPSYIIGVMYFSVTPSYPQMLPKHFVKSDIYDYLVNPDFAVMGAQPVYKYQLAPLQLSSEHLHDVFGYNRPYAEYLSRQDEVHGDFRGNMQDFILQRWFGDAPELNEAFTTIDSQDLTNIFSVVLNDDKIFGEIYYSMRASLPLPRSYAARSI